MKEIRRKDWSLNDIKVFAKKEKQPEILIKIIRTFRQDIAMQFAIKKCAKKSGEREPAKGIELQNLEIFRTLGENENHMYSEDWK